MKMRVGASVSLVTDQDASHNLSRRDDDDPVLRFRRSEQAPRTGGPAAIVTEEGEAFAMTAIPHQTAYQVANDPFNVRFGSLADGWWLIAMPALPPKADICP